MRTYWKSQPSCRYFRGSGGLVPVFRVLVLASCVLFSNPANNVLQIPDNTGCTCAGDVLTYMCTAVGIGTTVWQGTAFDCGGNSIVLVHNLYRSTGASGRCNNDAILGRSVSADGDCYTSELTVRVSPSLTNKTVSCFHGSGRGPIHIGSSTLTVKEAPYLPPDNVHLADARSGILTFKWTAFAPNCSSVNYEILSDCGTCPDTTNSTAVSCSNLQLSTNATQCTFSVFSMLCGDRSINPSNPVVVNLKGYEVSEFVIIPTYSNVNKTLTKVTILFNDSLSQISFAVTSDIVDSVTGYVVTFTPMFGLSAETSVAPTCEAGSCKFHANLPFSCSLSGVDIALSVASRLGRGPPSNPINMGCINLFVHVTYSSATFTMECAFLNQSTTITKSCRIDYWECSQVSGDFETLQVNTTSDIATINLERLRDSVRTYCYTVNASNGTHVVRVEGEIFTGTADMDGEGISVLAVVLPIVIIILLLFGLVLCGIIIIALILHKDKIKGWSGRRKGPYIKLQDVLNNTSEEEVDGEAMHRSASQLKLKRIKPFQRYFARFHVEESCMLKEFVKRHELEFKRGCVYYEFGEYTENISEDQEVVLLCQDTGKYYYSTADSETLRKNGLLGEGVKLKNIPRYKVFIQSMGTGVRHLKAGTDILYAPKHPLTCIDTKQFQLAVVPRTCSLSEFCSDLKCDSYSVFVEIDPISKTAPSEGIIDMILMEKDTRVLFTGNYAIVQQIFKQSPKVRRDHWRIFVTHTEGKSVQLQKDSWALCQVVEDGQEQHGCLPLMVVESEQFLTLNVKKKCTLAEFCKMHNLCPFLFVKEESLKQTPDDQKNESGVILMDEANRMFTRTLPWDEVIKYANQESVKARKKQWMIHLLKFSEDCRLKANTQVLCRKRISVSCDCLVPIHSAHFRVQEVKKGTSVDYRAFVLLDQSHKDKVDRIQDVILISKDTDNTCMFTGPQARRMVQEHFMTDQQIDTGPWNAYVIFEGEDTKGTTFKNSLQALCKPSKSYPQGYRVLKVVSDNIRLSDFVESLPSEKFENGRLFYEFTEAEDLISYKEAVRVEQKLIDKVEFRQSSSYSVFYNIPGVPGADVKPPEMKGHERLFLQSTSQGSRCLKRGALLLYKMEEDEIEHNLRIQDPDPEQETGL